MTGDACEPSISALPLGPSEMTSEIDSAHRNTSTSRGSLVLEPRTVRDRGRTLLAKPKAKQSKAKQTLLFDPFFQKQSKAKLLFSKPEAKQSKANFAF